MLMNERIQELINDQINYEMYSGYIYLSMAAYFESENLEGFANWMKIQAYEELKHAQKFFDYVNERGARVLLKSIQAPKTEWISAKEVFKEAYEHEKNVTARIYNIADYAIELKDHATVSFLNWYADEQVEEEANTLEILQKLEKIGDHMQGLFMLDSELSKREG